MAPVKSLFFSLVAIFRNRKAYLLYGAMWLALSLGVGMVAMLLLAFVLRFSGLILAATAMLPLSLVLAAIFFTSQWFTFRDSFDADSESTIP